MFSEEGFCGKAKKVMHKNLDIWKLGTEQVGKIYKLTETYPESERSGLISQIQRSTVSYPSNIAEGVAKSSSKEYTHFLYISLGSLSELENQVIFSEKPGYLKQTQIFADTEKL